MRIDQWLVNEGHARSRHRAAMLIKNGSVFINGIQASKNGTQLGPKDRVELSEKDFPWVSRGAFKLLHAIENFDLPVAGKTAIDIGSSTGGFTEVLLKHDIQKVYSVDVGSNQLHESLQNNPKVISMEQTDIRDIDHTVLAPAKIIVIDVSFISLQAVLNSAIDLLQNGGDCVALVKPQFEVSYSERSKKGVVTNHKVRLKVVNHAIEIAKKLGFTHVNTEKSPIIGGDGNVEYLLHLQK